jgi:uncharacterized protein YjbJ (UPF0337 family)
MINQLLVIGKDRRQKAKGKRQKAKGKRQKAKGKRQKAKKGIFTSVACSLFPIPW